MRLADEVTLRVYRNYRLVFWDKNHEEPCPSPKEEPMNCETRRAIEAHIEDLHEVSKQLDAWAKESRMYGWSTHQVDPMRKLSDSLLDKMVALRNHIRANQVG